MKPSNMFATVKHTYVRPCVKIQMIDSESILAATSSQFEETEVKSMSVEGRDSGNLPEAAKACRVHSFWED